MAGAFAEAQRDLEPLVRDWPESGRAWFYLALAHHKQKRYAEARVLFERAAEAPPVEPALHHFLGYCLYYLGDLPGARRAFESHLAAAPQEGNSHFGLGLIDLDEGRLDEAERRFRAAIDLQSNQPGRARDVAAAHVRLGDVLALRGELDAAASAFQHAAEIDPDLAGAHIKLYRIQLRLGLEVEARASLARYEEVMARTRPDRGFPE
jgi:tetratricopeptide (TPR) repeat protein